MKLSGNKMTFHKKRQLCEAMCASSSCDVDNEDSADSSSDELTAPEDEYYQI